MRDTWVIGNPLSWVQALICACAALRSFFDVPVALIGTPESRRQRSTSPDSTNASHPRKRSRYWPLKPPSREPRLANTSSSPTWSSAGQLAKNLPKLPCSAAISLTNLALSRTDLIFCGLRTMRLSDASFSQNSAGWNNSRLGLKQRKASSKPSHFWSMTLQTKPAEKTRAAISDSTRSSPSLASALLLGFLGMRLAKTFSPPLRLAARSRMRLKGTLATLFAIGRYSSQPSKKSNTLALNRPCAIIEKWSQPGMTTALAPGMASARPCGGPAGWARAPPVTRVGRRIAKNAARGGGGRGA